MLYIFALVVRALDGALETDVAVADYKVLSEHMLSLDTHKHHKHTRFFVCASVRLDLVLLTSA